MAEHQVFISHSSKDAEIAAAVRGALESAGVRCWIAPRDILPGRSWAGQIMGALSTSRVMVLVFSARSNESEQVLREVERAVTKGVTIIPFRIEAVEPSDSMEYFLGVPQWLDALTQPLEPHLEKLVRSVQTLLGEPSKPDAPEDAGVGTAAGRAPRWAMPRLARRPAAAVAVGVALVASAGLVWRYGFTGTAADQSVIAILPFRVTADSLRSWRTDAVELLAVKFTGDVGHRAVDPGTVLHAWEEVGGPRKIDLTREEKLRLAKRFGAARAVLGSIAGDMRQIQMTASLVDVETGESDVTATVTGAADNVGALLDTVAAQLLSHEAGEQQHL